MGGQFIQCLPLDGDHIVSKTYMTRIEGENTRLRHYLARLHRKTLCYSKSALDVEMFAALTSALFEVSDSPSSCLNHYCFSNARTTRFEQLKHPSVEMSLA
jgi:hypothetical protein